MPYANGPAEAGGTTEAVKVRAARDFKFVVV